MHRALHYLKLQTALLEALFIYVFWNSTTVVKADLSVGLVQGVLGSAFGAHQLNQRLLDMLPRTDTEFYFDKIQGLLGLICIEASGASSLQNGSIQPADLTIETIEVTDPAELHLLQSRDHIIQLHQSLGGASQDCTSREPFPLLLLGWASVLSQLPDYLQPEDQSLQDVPTFQKVATAALSPEMNVFERWSRMQSGALLRRPDYGARDEDDSMSYKETFHGRPFMRVFAVLSLTCSPCSVIDGPFLARQGVLRQGFGWPARGLGDAIRECECIRKLSSELDA